VRSTSFSSDDSPSSVLSADALLCPVPLLFAAAVVRHLDAARQQEGGSQRLSGVDPGGRRAARSHPSSAGRPPHLTRPLRLPPPPWSSCLRACSSTSVLSADAGFSVSSFEAEGQKRRSRCKEHGPPPAVAPSAAVAVRFGLFAVVAEDEAGCWLLGWASVQAGHTSGAGLQLEQRTEATPSRAGCCSGQGSADLGGHCC
jgi:hypothetical protein